MAYVGTPIDVGNQFSSLVGKRFSGDASTTAFTLDVRANSALDIEVFVENVRQDPNSAYTVDGTTLTFTAAPPSGTNNVYVVHQAPTVASVSPTAGSVTASSFDNSVISGHTALSTAPETTDEFLVSDAGTVKRVDFSLMGNTPSFAAKLASDQTIGNNSYTKLAFASEEWDTDSKYDASTNYRFTPTVVGKYRISAIIMYNNLNNTDHRIQLAIYKNGSFYAMVGDLAAMTDSSGDPTLNIDITISLDADDYVEAYTYQDTGGNVTIESDYSFFSGFKLIGV